MKTLLVLLLIGLATVGTGFRSWFVKYKAPPTAPYLADVSKQARKEYWKIMNKNKTIAELDKEFDAWAKKYKIDKKVNEFKKKMATIEEQTRKNVTELFAKLPAFLRNYTTIMDNKNQTRFQRTKAMIKLHDQNPKLFHVLLYTVSQVKQRPRRVRTRRFRRRFLFG